MKEKELSKSAAILLAFAAEKAMSAYEMVRLLGEVNAQRWFPVSESSVYATARLLEKNGLVAGEQVREGNMPEKTVFTVTAKGREMLERTIGAYLGTVDAANPEFDMAMLFACALPRKEVLARLAEKSERLRSDIQWAKKEHARLEKDPRVKPVGTCMIRHNRYLKEAELKTVLELIDAVEKEREWNWSVSTDLRKENAPTDGLKRSPKEIQ